MSGRFFGKQLSSFQIIISGFLAIILLGTGLLMLPAASLAGRWTSVEDALFTATSAVCVTGLVIRDTATYWSFFGQAVILVLIQLGGLGIATVSALIATISGRKITLLQRSMLQESISAFQVGGIVKLTWFVCRLALLAELLGTLLMLPTFLSLYGQSGIWMALFHSVSAFCNAGFDVMGTHTGAFSSLTAFGSQAGVILPVTLLIITGGIGFLTWDDIVKHRLRFKQYRMQSKVILTATALLVLLPGLVLFLTDFSDLRPKERALTALFHAVTPRTAGFNTVDLSRLSSASRAMTVVLMLLFHAVTPRTAGFNTVDLSRLSSASRAMTVVLMLVGGAPGSTAGGVKTTTAAVLLANATAVIRRRKDPRLFNRRIDGDTVKSASTLLMLYLLLALLGAFVISAREGLSFETCLFETASAIGTVGLSLGITPALGLLSRGVLVGLMFFGRAGALTLLFAAVNSIEPQVAQYPLGRINVG